MTVARATPTTLRREGRSYAVLPTDSIALIKTADALAIWAYLQSKPTDWIVRRTHIIERLALSRRRYADAMKHLRDIGLVAAIASHDDRGRMTGKTLICYDSPNIPALVHSGAPNVPVTERSVTPTFGESVRLPIKDIYTNNGILKTGETHATSQPAHSQGAGAAFRPYAGPVTSAGRSAAEEIIEERISRGEPPPKSSIVERLEARRAARQA